MKHRIVGIVSIVVVGGLPSIGLGATPSMRLQATTKAVAGASVPVGIISSQPLPAELPVVIQLLRGTRWTTVGTRTLTPTRATVRIRLRTIGRNRIRLLIGTERSVVGPVTITIRAALRRRLPVGASVIQIAGGGAGVWVLERDFSSSSSRVRQLDLISGRTRSVVNSGAVLQDLAVGASAAYVSTDDSNLLRIDPTTGRQTAAILPNVTGIAAGGAQLWATTSVPNSAGMPTETALAIDPATLQPTGVSASLAPTATTHTAIPLGDALWLIGDDPVAWGEFDPHDSQPMWFARANRTTGALNDVPRPFLAKGFDPTSENEGTLVPLSDTVTWAVRRERLRVRTPERRAPVYARTGYRIGPVRRSGRFAWSLQIGNPGPVGQNEILVQHDLASGVPTGRIVHLGSGARESSSFVIRGAYAWVLHPAEAAVLRVKIN